VEKSPRLNRATQFLFMVAFDGACFYQNGVNFLRRLALQKKNDDSSRHDVVEIARVVLHAYFQHL